MKKLILALLASFVASCDAALVDPSCSPSVDEKNAWATTLNARNEDALRDFLAKYPSGCYTAAAADALQREIKAQKIAAINGPDSSGGSFVSTGGY